jgi:alkylation response protein AidB-like acyl-CoA dehydrogenase
LDFDLNVEQEMIRKEVRKFATSEIAPMAEELDETETFSPELTKKMGKSACLACLYRKSMMARVWITCRISSP